jgi:PAS domain-containing protein
MSPENLKLKIGGHNLQDFKDTHVETHVGIELQMVLDAFPFYVMLLDADHKVLLANKAIRGDLGLVPDQIVGQYCPKVVHRLEEPYPGCPLEEAIKKGHGVEREFFEPDSNRWVNSAIYPIKRCTYFLLKKNLRFW